MVKPLAQDHSKWQDPPPPAIHKTGKLLSAPVEVAQGSWGLSHRVLLPLWLLRSFCGILALWGTLRENPRLSPTSSL